MNFSPHNIVISIDYTQNMTIQNPTDPHEMFQQECRERAAGYPDTPLAAAAFAFLKEGARAQYPYNFTWLGRPIIQFPQDIQAMQELIWSVKPDLIIETGIAHGGSLIFSASLLALLELCEASHNGTVLDPSQPQRKVIGIDIDIRPHNRSAIEAHPLANRITLLEGSSIAPDIVSQVQKLAAGFKNVMVCLDSMHIHDHVLAELEAYAPLVSSGSYCVVFDTLIEDMPEDMYPDRPWGPGNNPKTAARHYLARHPEFSVDRDIENKILVTVTSEGFLKKN